MRFAGPSCSCQSVDCASGAQKARSGGDRARIGPADLLIGGFVKAAEARAGDELVGLPEHGFARAEHKEALRRRHRAQPSKRSEEHTSELQSLMRISYAVFCLKKKNKL